MAKKPAPFASEAELHAHIAKCSAEYREKHPPKPERVLPRVAARLEAEKAFAEAARQGIGGNLPPPSVAQQIRELAEASYEAGWFRQTAVDLCVDERQLRRWLQGRGTPPELKLTLARQNAERRLARLQATLARHRSYHE